MDDIKEGEMVIILPYDDSRLCPIIDAAIKKKTAFEVKEFHKPSTHKDYSNTAVVVNIGGKDRVFGKTEVKRVNKK